MSGDWARNEGARGRRPLLMVIIPALNESASIAQVIARVPRQIPGIGRVEVVVVDDGSSDDTAAIARAQGASVLRHTMNMGVGKAMQTGLAEAVRRGADFMVNIDGDGQFAPEDIPLLLEPVVRGEAGMATASRFKDPRLLPEMPWVKRLGNRGMSWIVSTLVGQRFHDVSCGFRAYAREAILRLVLTGQFTYTQEMFLALSYHGLRITEVPIQVRGTREHGKSRVASNLFRYAYRTLQIIFACVRDYRPNLFFGTISAVLLVLGLGVTGFFIAHKLTTGSFSPHIWAGFVGAFLLGITLLLFVFGQIAAMVSRVRLSVEEQLYLVRRSQADNHDAMEARFGAPTERAEG